ncbi:MAG: GtrA family protein [Terriglobales bacterium]
MSSRFHVLEKLRGLEGFVRWLKFNFVGAVGVLVQLIALTCYRSLFHFDYLVATGFAVETAVIHNFLWHERFTWRDRPSAHLRESLSRFIKFNATNGAVSILGNLLIMRALVGEMQMNYVAANLIAVGVCSLVNFLLSDWLVFPQLEAETNSSPAIDSTPTT